MINTVLNARTLAEQLEKRQAANSVVLFPGSMNENLDAKEAKPYWERGVKVTNAQYRGSSGELELWQHVRKLQNQLRAEVENAAQPPSSAAMTALVGAMFIDITRRYQEKGDFTGLLVQELTNPDFPKSVSLQDFYKFIGEFEVFDGTGDSVPLVQQLTGETTSVIMAIRGIGWSTTLANILYNSVYQLQKVNDAVAEAYTDMRNSRVIGQLVAATYHSSQRVQSAFAGTQTFDENMYDLFRWGIKKLRALLDNLTSRPISTASGIICLCNSQDSWDIMRVINGALGGSGGAARGFNRAALPISSLIEYDQGATDGFTYGKKTLSFPGVTAGTAYLLVNDYGYVLNKRGLTLETGIGNVLQLSQEDRAWYNVQTDFLRDLLGSSFSAPPTGHESGYGAIVQLEMPTDDT